MDFADALSMVKQGGRVRREIWADMNRNHTAVLVLAKTDDPRFMPMLMIEYGDGMLRPFAGANWDLLAEDWEIA